MAQSFDSFCIVELMGRQVIAGRVTEQTIGGCALLRVDIPEVDGTPAFTKFYGASSIYCLTPCDEATARAAVAGLRPKPVNVYQLNLPPGIAADQPLKGEDWDPDEDHQDDDPATW